MMLWLVDLFFVCWFSVGSFLLLLLLIESKLLRIGSVLSRSSEGRLLENTRPVMMISSKFEFLVLLLFGCMVKNETQWEE